MALMLLRYLKFEGKHTHINLENVAKIYFCEGFQSNIDLFLFIIIFTNQFSCYWKNVSNMLFEFY